MTRRQPSTATLLIHGGTLVTPEGLQEADLLVQGEQIKAIGCGLPTAQDTRLLDATGCFVLPGVVDAHTHIALDTGIYRSTDNAFIGTQAAACGGVTTVVDFATQFPGQTLRQAVEARRAELSEAVIDYGLHVMVTDLPPGREGEMADLLELGVPSIKLYTTYRPNYYADDGTILRLMAACAPLGILTLVHCEDDELVTAQTAALIAAGQTRWRDHGRSRPALAEERAVERVLVLAQQAHSPVHIVHCTTARAVAMVADARARGQPATCETCPQYLLLDSTVYDGPEPWRYILQPPLRVPDELERLWAQVTAGVVDMLTTDHCDYAKEQKAARDDFTQTPGGLPGLETLLPLTATAVAKDRITWPDLVRLLSANPARIWGLWPRKGALLPGSDADIVIYDPRPQTPIHADRLHHHAGYTPYEGFVAQGQVRTTLSRGHIVFHLGRFNARPGRGRFVPRPVAAQTTGGAL